MTKISLTLAICAMFSLTATTVSAMIQPASSPIIQAAELDTNELANGMTNFQCRLNVADNAEDYDDCDKDKNSNQDSSTSLQYRLNIAHCSTDTGEDGECRIDIEEDDHHDDDDDDDNHDDHQEDNNPPKS